MAIWSKKLLFLLVSLQLLIIWLIYQKSDGMLSYIQEFAQHFPVLHSYRVISGKEILHLPLTHSKDMLPFYLEVATDIWCFRGGTDIDKSLKGKKCSCLTEWYGMDCGIPQAVWKSEFLKAGKVTDVAIQRLERPRRVLSSLAFINEYDLLEIKLREMFEVVDVFVIAEEAVSFLNESNRKSLPLFTKLQSGYLLEFQSKVVHIPVKLNNRTSINSESLWQLLMHKYLWQNVWKYIANFRPDDLFLISEISAIPSKDVLLFLKLYSGYPEPVTFNLRPLVYSFSQLLVGQSHDLEIVKIFACTFQFLNTLCHYDITRLLRNSCLDQIHLKQRFESTYWKIQKWTLGTSNVPSGWLCRWCMRVDDLKEMLLSHPWLDGTIYESPEVKRNKTFLDMYKSDNILINGIVRNLTKIPRTDSFLAPPDVLKYKDKYANILDVKVNNSS